MKGRELAVFLAIRVVSCTQNGRTCGLNRWVLERGPPGAHARVSGRLEEERFVWKPRKCVTGQILLFLTNARKLQRGLDRERKIERKK
jgi:hypothetical protein